MDRHVEDFAVDAGPVGAGLIVGVTSHRDIDPAQLPALRAQVREALSMLQAEFPELPLVIVSALAEGGDRLVAEEGLALGARLIVPLPNLRLVGGADAGLLAQVA